MQTSRRPAFRPGEAPRRRGVAPGPTRLAPTQISIGLSEPSLIVEAGLDARIADAHARTPRLAQGLQSSRCHQSVSKSDLQIELLLLARSSIRDAGNEVKPFAELSHGFLHRTPRDRLLACLEPVVDRFLGQASFGAMLR